MIERHGTDTTIGWVPGGDTANTSTGEGQKAVQAARAWGGWESTPELAVYTYPSGGPNEPWVWKSSGDGPLSIRSFAIPNGYDVAAMQAGHCDHIWRERAASIVAHGFGGRCRYFPGYEGNDVNFNGSAGIVGDRAWGEAVSRQIRVMAEVDGWEPWIGINYHVHNANRTDNLDPDVAYDSITEPYHSVDLDWYDMDDFSGRYPVTDVDACIAYTIEIYEAQLAMAQKHGKPMGFGEWGPLWRSDGHGGGDRWEVLAAAVDWIKAHDVAHLCVFDGSNMPGDNGQFATYRYANGQATYTTAAEYPKAAPWIAANLDPADFVGRDGPPDPTPEPSDLEARVTELERWRADVANVSAGDLF